MIAAFNKTVKRSVFVVSMACGFGAHTLAADTLADALTGAYTSSGLLEQNRALLRAADEDVASAAAALRPILRYSGNLARGFGDQQTSGVASNLERSSASVSLIAELMLYDAGAGRAAIDAAKGAARVRRLAAVGSSCRASVQRLLRKVGSS